MEQEKKKTLIIGGIELVLGVLILLFISIPVGAGLLGLGIVTLVRGFKM